MEQISCKNESPMAAVSDFSLFKSTVSIYVQESSETKKMLKIFHVYIETLKPFAANFATDQKPEKIVQCL
jgi:hypothetical protein